MPSVSLVTWSMRFCHRVGNSPLAAKASDGRHPITPATICRFKSPLAATAFQWYSRVQYMLDAPIAHAIGGVLINKRTFYKLSEEHQEVLRRVTRDFAVKTVAVTRHDNAEALNVLQDSGVKFVPPPAELLAEFDGFSKKMVDKCIPKLFSRDLYSRIQKVLAEYRKTGGKKWAPPTGC